MHEFEKSKLVIADGSHKCPKRGFVKVAMFISLGKKLTNALRIDSIFVIEYQGQRNPLLWQLCWCLAIFFTALLLEARISLEAYSAIRLC